MKDITYDTSGWLRLDYQLQLNSKNAGGVPTELNIPMLVVTPELAISSGGGCNCTLAKYREPTQTSVSYLLAGLLALLALIGWRTNLSLRHKI